MASDTHATSETGPLTGGPAIDSSDDADANRPRRRLGAWQSAAIATETPAAVDHDTGQAHSVAPTATSRFGHRRQAPEPGAPVDGAIEDDAPSPAVARAPSRLETLINLIQANPNDVAALTELAAELHARGMVNDARNIQNRLAAIQANERPAAPTTVPALERLPGTATLNGAGRARRAGPGNLRETMVLPTMISTFPLADLGFTIPLPGERELSAEAREIVEQSGRELGAGRLKAAFDSCVIAIDRAPDYMPIHLRIAEIHARRRSARRAQSQAEAVARLSEVTGHRDHLWMAQRVLLHASESDLHALKSLVDSLIDARRPDEAARYGAKLIEHYVDLGETADAFAVSRRLCALSPGNAAIALGNVELLAKNGDVEGAMGRWEQAVAAGADPHVARASMAALIAADRELDHWRLLSEAVRDAPPSAIAEIAEIAEAYERTINALPPSPVHAAGRAMLLEAGADPNSESALLAAMTDPAASNISRAFVAAAVAQKLDHPERISALRIAIAALAAPSELDASVWNALLGAAPKVEDLEEDLGETLLAGGDATGAMLVLQRASARDPRNAHTSQLLADAHIRTGQLGAALVVLDKLAINLRAADRLEEMAAVLRKMSLLAPNNIKVKTRLIDAYLQRGFVEEARIELLARATLEENGGRVREAALSLQRSADLSWGLGKYDESFETYNRLIELTPDDGGNRSALVNLYLQQGRISEAAEHQRAVVNISMRSGSKHEAIAALHQVIGLTPDDSTAYYQLGDLLSAMGEHHQAERVFKRLALMSPNDRLAREKAAEMALLKQADVRRAEASLS